MEWTRFAKATLELFAACSAVLLAAAELVAKEHKRSIVCTDDVYEAAAKNGCRLPN